jgi:hypothetical protein
MMRKHPAAVHHIGLWHTVRATRAVRHLVEHGSACRPSIAMRFVLPFIVLAMPTFAQDADAASIEAMIAAIEEAGCVVTAENGDAVLAASGLNEEQTMAVIAELYGNGLVALQDESTMKLTNGTCQ